MLDIERIVKLQAEVIELYAEPNLVAVDTWGIHVQRDGLLEIEPDKLLWIIEKRPVDEDDRFPYEVYVTRHGVRWFAIGTLEEFELDARFLIAEGQGYGD